MTWKFRSRNFCWLELQAQTWTRLAQPHYSATGDTKREAAQFLPQRSVKSRTSLISGQLIHYLHSAPNSSVSTQSAFSLWLWKRLLSAHPCRTNKKRIAVPLLLSEIPSGMCAKLRTVAASNNRDHPRRSLYYCLFAPHIYGISLHAHPVRGESHI